MKNLIVLFLLSVVITNISAQQPAFITDSLDVYIQREMERWKIPGVAVAIVKNGKTVVTKGYGVSDIETKQKVDENTLFMIASNTKLFTASALAMLANDGKISMEDKVVDWIPYFKMHNETLTPMVTIEDILSHRLGFETFQGDFFNWGNNVSRKRIIENIGNNEVVYDFRDTWGYCNAGFVTAGEIIPAVTDTSWDDFILHNFFIPMEMNRSSTTYEKIVADKNACKAYTMSEGKLVKLGYDNLNNIAACASINSCVNDISHWMITQLDEGKYKGKEIISEQAIMDTRFPRSIVSDGQSGLFKSQHFDLYGLGVGLNDYEGRQLVWHTGGADGFVTTVCMIPDEELGISVLTNTDANYLFLAALYQIIEAYFDMPYRNLSSTFYGFYERNEKAKDQEISDWYATAAKGAKAELPLKEYAGTYYNSVYGKMEIKLEKGNLNMYFEHHPQLTGKLQLLKGNDFVCTYDPINWGVKEIPFAVENERVMSVTVTINDFIDFMPYEFIKED
ncbi:MAG: serine hydrolase [Bacteroidetes bacterium]|jgi:CubicO group peptidase (beta-lactamase class C family)|nr:serine hydrolase [Bacteroidota bacterium]MBP8916018.1 serine hydrolase [Chitinophagales bacterium]